MKITIFCLGVKCNLTSGKWKKTDGWMDGWMGKKWTKGHMLACDIYVCGFCSTHLNFKTRPRVRAVQSVLERVKAPCALCDPSARNLLLARNCTFAAEARMKTSAHLLVSRVFKDFFFSCQNAASATSFHYFLCMKNI